jgi:ring-1,2-phenylacetyl-CoA epoxidase subunit PaaE
VCARSRTLGDQPLRLRRDSVALTFEVPPKYGDSFRFTPGQHLTLRRVADGDDPRPTYSVCSSTGPDFRR